MHRAFHLRPLHLLLPFLCIGLYQVASTTYGGVDIDRYWLYSYNANFYNNYFAKEFLSWGILKFISNVSSREFFIFWVFCFSAIIGSRLRLNELLIFLASVISPIGVLLFANILRQGIGTAFFVLATFYLIKDRYIYFLIFASCAIFSHNSFVIPFAFVLIFDKFVKNKGFLKFCVGVGAFVFLLVYSYYLGTQVDGGDGFSYVDDGLENYVYGFLAAALCLLWSFLGERRDKTVANAMLIYLAISFFVVLYNNIPAWIAGRLSLSVGFLALFFVYRKLIDRRFGLLAVITGCVLGVTGISVHVGALNMLM